MDTLTHALSGALAARATAPRTARISVPVRMAAGFFAAAFPDVDWVLAYVSPVAYVTGHRGVTHSLLLLPLWAGLVSLACAKIDRGGATWRDYYGVCAIGIGMHILGDLITSFGTIVFAPVSDARFAWSTTFIIDLWFTGIIVAGLAAAWLWRRSRAPAVLGLAALAGYVALQAVLHSRAVAVGVEHAQRHGLGAARVAALPRPVSPFNWMVIVRSGEEARYSFVNLARREPLRTVADAGFIARLDAAYLPLKQAQWVYATRFGSSDAERVIAREAWSQPKFAFYRWFAEEPVLLRVERGNPSTCAWFEDLRFFTPGRNSLPFRYGMCREEGGQWELFRLDGDSKRVAVR